VQKSVLLAEKRGENTKTGSYVLEKKTKNKQKKKEKKKKKTSIG